jgi:ABC-type lipoprotein release transport system permease subunit
MTAAWMWVRADLRRRWRSWVVLGLLAGVSVGLACAGVAGARRTERAVPDFARAARLPDAAVLANDFGFDAAHRARIAALPEVTASYPFMVPILLEVTSPKGFEASLVPETPATARSFAGVIVDGRRTDPARADEIIVNENARDKFGLDLGRTVTLAQQPPPDPSQFPVTLSPEHLRPFSQRLRVVGISKAQGDELDWTPSSGFYEKYQDRLIGFTNQFVDLRRDQTDLPRFQADVERVTVQPTNVESVEDLYGLRKLRRVTSVERNGLLLFALAVLIGAGALVGQALVRAVSVGAAELSTARALGVDRKLASRAMVLPALVVAVVGAVTTIVVAVALSPRFPIALIRQYELDTGIHADWTVLLGGAAGLCIAVMATAWITAELRVRRDSGQTARTPLVARWATAGSFPPALLIGSRLATEPGRGRRAVPVRSALVGAIVGVIGVVGCLTFRSGLADTVANPERSGVVWDYGFATAGRISDGTISAIEHDRAVESSVHATWARAISIDGRSTPTFGTETLKGTLDFVVLAGRAPANPNELALAPVTMDSLRLHIGDEVMVGPKPGRRMQVVGRALVPATSHTDYDQSAWMTASALDRSIPARADASGDFTEDYVLIRWKGAADTSAAMQRFERLLPKDQPTEAQSASLPAAVTALRDLRVLPLALALFFALLAIATVAHALVTTVRRRRGDLAILRSLGFTRRDARIAIAWQSTLLAIAGLVIGIPLGIVAGRLAWKQLADSFPVVYVPPLALVAVLLVVPVAILVANALAAGPAHAATRIRPARVLRTE